MEGWRWTRRLSLMVVHINHVTASSACRSCGINTADLLLLCARFQVDFTGGDLNAFSYRYFRTGSQQTAASLQDSSLAVTPRRFDEGINAQFRDTYENHPEYQFRSGLYMARHDKDIEEYRLKRDDILNETTDAQESLARFPGFRRLFRSLMRPSMSSVLSTSTGDTPGSSRSLMRTGASARDLSLRARAQSSRKICSSVSCRSGKDVQDVRHEVIDRLHR